jgi:radical SAM protein with 4Fe4S-binding SPASM domain
LHGIQTNLITYSPEWRDLYRDHFGGQVGVSWDPGIRLLRGSNERYEAEFWPRLRQLRDDGLHAYFITTATRVFFERFRNPFDYFCLLESSGIQHAHLERLTPTGYARSNWDRLGLSHREYSEAMVRFARAYALYKDDPTHLLQLSPFDGLRESVRELGSSRPAGYGCWSGVCDHRFHTVDANGYQAGCTALTADPTSGPVATDPTSFAPIRFHREARIRACGGCRYRTICNSGCQALPYSDGSGECSGGRLLFGAIESLIANQERLWSRTRR